MSINLRDTTLGHKIGGGEADSGSEKRRRLEKNLYRNLSAAAFVTILLYLAEHPDLLHFRLPAAFPLEYLRGGLATLAVFYFGWDYPKAFFSTVFAFRADLRAPWGAGILILYLYGLISWLRPSWLSGFGLVPEGSFGVLAGIVTLFLLYEFLRVRVFNQVEAPFLTPRLEGGQTIHLLWDGKEKTVALHDLRAGDVILLKTGERVPADGTIVRGHSKIDELAVTGCGEKVEKGEGARVFAGSVNQGPPLWVRAEGVGEETLFARSRRTLANALKGSPDPLENRGAGLLLLFSFLLPLLCFLGWRFWGGRGAAPAFSHSLWLLLALSPSAFALFRVLPLRFTLFAAFGGGCLLKSPRLLDSIQKTKALLFDKGGALVQKKCALHQVIVPPQSPLDEDSSVELAASIEKNSDHPMARAFEREAAARGVTLVELEALEDFPGRGRKAQIQGETFYLGSEVFLKEQGIMLNPFLRSYATALEEKWATPIYLAAGHRVFALFALDDPLKKEAREVMGRLKKAGFKLGLLTGDSKIVAEKIGASLEMDGIFSGLSPQEKMQRIEDWQKETGAAAWVGEEEGRSLLFPEAILRMGFFNGERPFAQGSDIVFLQSDLRLIPSLWGHVRSFEKRVRRNLLFSISCNTIPLIFASGMLDRFLPAFPSPLTAAAWGALLPLGVIFSSLSGSRRKV